MSHFPRVDPNVLLGSAIPHTAADERMLALSDLMDTPEVRKSASAISREMRTFAVLAEGTRGLTTPQTMAAAALFYATGLLVMARGLGLSPAGVLGTADLTNILAMLPEDAT